MKSIVYNLPRHFSSIFTLVIRPQEVHEGEGGANRGIYEADMDENQFFVVFLAM